MKKTSNYDLEDIKPKIFFVYYVFPHITLLILFEFRICQKYWNILQSLSAVYQVSAHKNTIKKNSNFRAVQLDHSVFLVLSLLPVHNVFVGQTNERKIYLWMCNNILENDRQCVTIVKIGNLCVFQSIFVLLKETKNFPKWTRTT